MEYSDRNGDERAEYSGRPVEVLHWDAAIDDSGEQPCVEPGVAYAYAPTQIFTMWLWLRLFAFCIEHKLKNCFHIQQTQDCGC